MAVVKKTKSGKAVQFIDEDGTVFGTSVVSIHNMLNGAIKGDFVLLSRMPWKVNPGRFKESPLYEPPGYIPPKDESKNNSDALSVQNRKQNQDKKIFEDKKVW